MGAQLTVGQHHFVKDARHGPVIEQASVEATHLLLLGLARRRKGFERERLGVGHSAGHSFIARMAGSSKETDSVPRRAGKLTKAGSYETGTQFTVHAGIWRNEDRGFSRVNGPLFVGTVSQMEGK
ncbi:hypothetical protein GCM10023213_40260 [Prosthecobacter algae]|uniref:Uncharacterized protein n=1 Tax=Prosthecobacter algae TaxID=1144682 RepID=A0ABP9PHK3_9BACT